MNILEAEAFSPSSGEEQGGGGGRKGRIIRDQESLRGLCPRQAADREEKR